MQILKLSCTNCGSPLKWEEKDKTFTCENCGTKYQTDNNYTFHIIDEAKIKEQEVELEKSKQQAKKDKSDNLTTIIIVIFIGLFLLAYVIGLPLILSK